MPDFATTYFQGVVPKLTFPNPNTPKETAQITNESEGMASAIEENKIVKATRGRNRPSNSNLSGGILVNSNDATNMGPNQAILDQHNFISLINNSNIGINGSSTVAATPSQIYLPQSVQASNCKKQAMLVEDMQIKQSFLTFIYSHSSKCPFSDCRWSNLTTLANKRTSLSSSKSKTNLKNSGSQLTGGPASLAQTQIDISVRKGKFPTLVLSMVSLEKYQLEQLICTQFSIKDDFYHMKHINDILFNHSLLNQSVTQDEIGPDGEELPHKSYGKNIQKYTGKLLTAVFKDYLIYDDIYEFIDGLFMSSDCIQAISQYAENMN